LILIMHSTVTPTQIVALPVAATAIALLMEILARSAIAARRLVLLRQQVRDEWRRQHGE